MSHFDAARFAELLRQAYQRSPYKSHSALAKEVGVSRATVSGLMGAKPQSSNNKPSQPRPELVVKLATALETDIDHFLLTAGHAPLSVGRSEVDDLAHALAQTVMASGFDDLEDEGLRQSFLDDMKSIAESMLKRKLEEQSKRRSGS